MRIAYTMTNICLFGFIQLLTWEAKEVQFLINIFVFGVSSFMLWTYYKKSKS